MNPCCLICNNRAGLALRKATSLFGDHVILESGKKLSEVVSEILEKPLEENKVHANLVCKRCYNVCIEYDSTNLKLQSLKSELLCQFKSSIASYNMDYSNYEKYTYSISTADIPSVVTGKRLVLPASKLQPIPSDMLLKVGKLPNILSKLKPTSSTVNLKVTVGTSVLTQTIKTTTSMTPDAQANVTTISKSYKDSLVSHKEFSLPDIEEEVSQGNENSEENEETTMEIDENCSLSVVSTSEGGDLVLKMEGRQSEDKGDEYYSVELPQLEGGSGDEAEKFILGKLEILNQGDDEQEDDDEQSTLVLDSENGSILRFMSGRKFIYDGGEISLVVPDEDSQTAETGDHQDLQDDDEQIELQVSGDEETANAIIAAAQEQGGAFIKVESGEMFRVKSVHSDATEDDDSSAQIVVREGRLFRCVLCTNSTANDGTFCVGDADTMMRHLKTTHDARIYICQVCAAVMRKRSEYTDHIAEHAQKLKKLSNSSKGKLHTCEECGKRYNSRTLLREHANTHRGLRPYQCLNCHKTFASKYTHQAHLRTHEVRPRPFKCDQCGKSFLTQQNLTQHEKTHSGIKDFVCNVCNKAFSTQHNLEVHGVVHSGNKAFVCSACGKAFARRAELRDHVRIHTGERPFACDVCDARFTQRSNLHSHKRATHLDDKRYHCTQCSKRFKRRRLLEYHIKACHTGERPLVCEVCHASFVYPEHYKKHIRIHSGERPYVCEICGKSFNSRDNRNTHRFVHSDKKPYECVHCGAGYMRKQLLYAHMNSSGHLAESIVVNQPRVTKVATEAVYETEEGISDQTEEKSTLGLVHEGEDPALLTLQNINEKTLLEAVDAEQLGDQAEIVANCDNGGMLRLIQIKLPDGNNGWVAFNR